MVDLSFSQWLILILVTGWVIEWLIEKWKE